MANKFLKSGALLATFSVIIGAFGAHLLKPSLIANGNLETFETAVKYQFYGSFGLLAIGLLPIIYQQNKYYIWAGVLQIIGTLIFSGSLYLICITGVKLFGAVAPIGGTCLIISWLAVFLSLKNNRN